MVITSVPSSVYHGNAEPSVMIILLNESARVILDFCRILHFSKIAFSAECILYLKLLRKDKSKKDSAFAKRKVM